MKRNPTIEQPRRNNRRTLLSTLAVMLFTAAGGVHAEPPVGLMLNLDCSQISEGVIPSISLYPLHVPIGELEVGSSLGRPVLLFKEGQGLDVPHSSLLDPNGTGWVTSIRFYAQTNGMIMSQCNDDQGYAVYIRDGTVEVAIQTAHTTLYLRENSQASMDPCLNRWITLELIIKPDIAMLVMNRIQTALIPLQAPLDGENLRIRIGEHERLPSPLARSRTAKTNGFTGAISSLKMMRQ